ncbi:c-type cytochrome [Microvirga makkahensis]|uniref:C-type cytochrome n=1 Tax=Microvirga makkahensis TaxID=1128670 RepID=A0A7X3SRQ2_9HYPH|nr:c-type cytochrome [Microvirga makkahensis]MXQ14314.1 c-type cytochrome [Microvirga makkahensis]
MTRAIPLALGIAILAATPVFSQSQTPPAGPSGAPDIIRGQEIALGGLRDRQNVPCIQCHGLEGAGNSSGAFPRLVPQSGWYLYKTLQDYASGLRPNEIMSPIARSLSDQDMQAVAAYYASIENAPALPQAEVDVRTLQTGGAISAVGIPEQGVPPCAGCHGANGRGGQMIYPALAGQYAPYTELQLRLWKEGRRDGDPMNVMELISKAMTDEQIRAVSLYFASIQPGYSPQGEQRPAGPRQNPQVWQGQLAPLPPNATSSTRGLQNVKPPYLPEGQAGPGMGNASTDDQINRSR